MTLGLKYKLVTFIFLGSPASFNFWCACWGCASVPDRHTQYTHQFPMHMHSSVSYMHAQHVLNGPFQIWNCYMLSIRVRNWWVWSGYASILDLYAQGMHQFLIHMLRACISSWPVCSGYASVPDLYVQHILKGLHAVQALAPVAYAQCMYQLLTHMLSPPLTSILIGHISF